MAEEVLEVFDPTVAPVVGDHPVRHVQVLGLSFVPEIDRLDEVVATVVGVDVVVPGVPALGGHVDPAAHVDLKGRPLAGTYIDRSPDRLVLETPPHLDIGSSHGQRHREAAVCVEVVVLRDAHHARVATVGEVAASVGALQVDARREQLPVAHSDPNVPRRLRPGVILDPDRLWCAAASADCVEAEAHIPVGRALLIGPPSVACVGESLTVG